MFGASRRILAVVLVAMAALAAAMIGVQPASAAPADCWYCTVTIEDTHRSEYRTSQPPILDLGRVSFTVRLGFVPSSDVYVGWKTSVKSGLTINQATAGTDYQQDSGTVSVPAGTSTAKIWVTVNADTIGEANEWFQVELTSTSQGHIDDGDKYHDAIGIGTILDDDPARLSVVDAKPVNEYNDLTFTVRLSAPLDHEVRVYARTTPLTGSGYATEGDDYDEEFGWVTFVPGETSRTVTIPVIHDQELDEIPELVRVELKYNNGATIADSSAWGTIYEVDFLS